MTLSDFLSEARRIEQESKPHNSCWCNAHGKVSKLLSMLTVAVEALEQLAWYDNPTPTEKPVAWDVNTKKWLVFDTLKKLAG